MLVREKSEQKKKKKKLQTGWDFENLDFENFLTKVQGTFAVGFVFSLLTEGGFNEIWAKI